MYVEKLIGKEFKGAFRRDPKDILALREHREKVKNERPDLLSNYDRLHGTSDTKDGDDCQPFDFNLWLCTYEPSSRRFFGRMKDSFGNSELVGRIDDDKLSFIKNYIGEKPIESIGWSRYKDCKFVGKIRELAGGRIHACGTYDPAPDAGYKGVWEMDLHVK